MRSYMIDGQRIVIEGGSIATKKSLLGVYSVMPPVVTAAGNRPDCIVFTFKKGIKFNCWIARDSITDSPGSGYGMHRGTGRRHMREVWRGY